MNPLVNKARKTSHEDNFNPVANAALPPVQRSRSRSDHARTSKTAAAAGCSKRPIYKLGQVPIAVAADFSTAVGQLIAPIAPQLNTAHFAALSRPCQRCVELGPRETNSRKEYSLAGAAPL
jgi:hypothetical protein